MPFVVLIAETETLFWLRYGHISLLFNQTAPRFGLEKTNMSTEITSCKWFMRTMLQFVVWKK